MISKTKIKKQMSRKTNPNLAGTISLALKNKPWNPTAKLLSSPTKNHSKVNIKKIDEQTKEGDTVVIPGKVLSKGKLTKKIRIAAFSFSKQAKEKLKDSEVVSISDEINNNKKAEGIKIIK